MATNGLDLDAHRRAVGISIAALARAAGVPYPKVWQALSGWRRFTAEEIACVEQALRDTEQEQP